MKNKSNFMQLLREFKTLKNQLSEDFVFDGGDDGEVYGDDEQQAQQSRNAMEEPHGNDEYQDGDSEEEKAMEAQETIQHEPIIGKIRETAIEGLKKYSSNPTSKIYEFFKKVFLESDKVLTDNSSK